MTVLSRHATLHELQTVYGSEDLQDFVEMILVDAHNKHAATELAKKKAEDGKRS
jgi:hypothetical protein